MDNNNLYYMEQLNQSSSFEYPQCSPIPSTPPTPCRLPKKPRQREKPKEKYICQQTHYSDDVPGLIDFDFGIIHLDNSVAKYSKNLKRFYTTTSQGLRIRFNWTASFQPLFLRSAVVFAEEYHTTTPVLRCYAHRGPELPHNIGVGHDELKCVFKASDSANICETVYQTDVNGILTSRTALRPGDCEAWMDYTFYCQNSCPTGINRRHTKMIFLIEDAMGVVAAKRSVLIQICSNPKRDREREENRIALEKNQKKRKRQSQPPLPPNNSKNSDVKDDTVCTLDFQVLGEDNYKAVLKYAYDLMAAEAIRTGNHQLYKPHMDALLTNELEG